MNAQIDLYMGGSVTHVLADKGKPLCGKSYKALHKIGIGNTSDITCCTCKVLSVITPYQKFRVAWSGDEVRITKVGRTRIHLRRKSEGKSKTYFLFINDLIEMIEDGRYAIIK